MKPGPHREAQFHDDRDLMRRHRDGDRRARATLIERYLPLARSLAWRYRSTTEPLDDLVQVASIGLVKAADRWEPERGLAFSTYAVPTILGELRRYFRDSTWAVRPPRGLIELSQSVERAREPLSAAIGREPAPGDFAEHLGHSPAAIAEAVQAAGCRWACSLESPIHDDSAEAMTLGESIGGDDDAYEQVPFRARAAPGDGVVRGRRARLGRPVMALRHLRRLRWPAVVLVATIALPEPAASSPTGRC